MEPAVSEGAAGGSGGGAEASGLRAREDEGL